MVKQARPYKAEFTQELNQIVANCETYAQAKAAFDAWKEPLKTYQVWGDFRGLGRVEVEGPAWNLCAPEILNGFFRMWLRKKGLDPNKLKKR